MTNEYAVIETLGDYSIRSTAKRLDAIPEFGLIFFYKDKEVHRIKLEHPLSCSWISEQPYEEYIIWMSLLEMVNIQILILFEESVKEAINEQ